MTPWQGRDLTETIALDQIGETRFQNQVAQSNGNTIMFGGQMLGLALASASRTAPDRLCHSMHSYFLRPVAVDIPVTCDVEIVRDGGAFSARRVVASQHGKSVFQLECSFQSIEQGIDHMVEKPDVAGPDGIESLDSLLVTHADRVRGNHFVRLARQRGVEMRPVDPEAYIFGGAAVRARRLWLRAPGAATAITPSDHQSLLAYLSDFWLAGAAVLPIATDGMPRMFMSTISHAMWFHRPFRVDEWLLLDCETPSIHGGRGMARGTMYDQNGAVVASVAMELLMRRRQAA